VGNSDWRRRAAQQSSRLCNLGAFFPTVGTNSTSAGSTSARSQLLGLAQVKKVAPKPKFDTAKTRCDLATVQAVITHRYDVLAKYAKSLRDTCTEEIQSLKARAVSVDGSTVRRILHTDAKALPVTDRAEMNQALRNSNVLTTVYTMRQELTELWERSSASTDQLVRQLENWCARAEQSNIVALQDFSRRLRRYA
jgi:stearoyl-CoA desaturase (delta-9 desaturase)